MNKHIRTRLLSVLMALTLMLGLVPTAALAEGEDAAPETVAAEETVPETPETPEEAPETEEPDAEPAEDAEEPTEDAEEPAGDAEAPAEEPAEEADAAAVLAEESTLKEGTYTVTANLYVPGSENVILTGVTAYLTNTRVPPVSPVEKNAKLVVDADGNMTLTIKNLNPVFTLQRIEDAEGLKISQRFMEEGKFGSCTSRINGLEFQLLEKKDVYSFPDCEEMPCLNDHMSMLSMPLELKIDYDSATEGYVEPGAANTKSFHNVYKGYDDALTYLDVVVSVPSDYSSLLDNAELTAAAVDESTFDGAQALKDLYIDPTPVMKFFELKLVDTDGNEITLPEDGVSIAMNYGARTFYEEGIYQDIAAYVDGEWVDLDRVTTKSDLYAPEYMVTAEHLGIFAAVENDYYANHKYDLTAKCGDARWDIHSVAMWGYKSLIWDILTNVNAKQTEIENVGTAYQFTQQSVGNSEVDKDNTTITLTLPHKDGMNYYLVAWNTKNLDQRKLNSIRVGGSDVISVVCPSEDKNTRDYYLLAIQRWMSNEAAVSGETTSAFVLATTKKLAEVALTKTTEALYISSPTYTGDEVTAPIAIGNGQAAVEGNTATEAGDYTASITPQGEYIWADGTQDTKTIDWKVFSNSSNSKTTVVPAFENASICYGDAFDGKIVLKDSKGNLLSVDDVFTAEGKAKLDLTAEIEALKDESGSIPVGTHNFKIKFTPQTDLIDTDAYSINRTVPLTLNVYPAGFNIGTDKQLQKPAATAIKTWTGVEQCLVTSYSSGYKTDWTVSGQNWGKAPGKYTVTITPNENVWWNDGTKGAYTVDWYIKKTVAAPTAAEGLTYTGKEQVGVPEGEGYTVTGGTAAEEGTHTATVTLNDYYMWSDSTLEDSFTLTYVIAPADDNGNNGGDNGSNGGNNGGSTEKDKVTTVTANLYLPGEYNQVLPGITVYLNNSNNPIQGTGTPTVPKSNNAKLTTQADGTMLLTLDITNPVFTLQKIDGCKNATVTSTKLSSDVLYRGDPSEKPHTTRISQITVELNDKSGVYEFRDCTEFPTLIGDDWNYNLILKVQFDGGKDGSLDSNKDVDTGNIGGSTTTVTTPETDKGFTDVDENAYYKAAVDWAVEKGITSGTTATTFAPSATCTRAQTVTFLWRAAGSPEPTQTENPFTDVKADAYYYKAVLWAVEKGITAGTTETTFTPDATVTRAQVVTFQNRMAGSPKAEGVNPFSDVADNAYYHDAVLWAAKNGITSGMTETTFAPNAGCTRGQIVTFLYRQLAK